MAIETQTKYFAPYIGEVDQQTRDLLVYFLTHGGANKTRDYFFRGWRSPFVPRPDLFSLDKTLDRFMESPKRPISQQEFEQCSLWHDTTFDVLSESFLDTSGEIGLDLFLSSSDLLSLIRTRASKGLTPIVVDPVTLRCGESRSYPVFANGMIFNAGDGTLVDLYDCRRMAPGKGYTRSTGRIAAISFTLTNPDTKLVFQDTVQTALNLSNIIVPPLDEISFREITAQKASSLEPPTLLGSANRLRLCSDPNLAMCVEITPLSIFVLRLLTNQLPHIPPEEYFKPVN